MLQYKIVHGGHGSEVKKKLSKKCQVVDILFKLWHHDRGKDLPHPSNPESESLQVC